MTDSSMSQLALRISFLAIAVISTADAASAQGQRENYNATLRADCRLALQVITTGRPEPKYDWAIDRIASCDDTAGEAVPTWIRRASNDSLDLLKSRIAGRTIRDQRILDAVMEVARSSALAWRPRVSALRIMMSYIDPSIVVEPEDITTAPHNEPTVHVLGHAHQIEGTHPLAPGAPVAIRALFESLAAADPDQKVRSTARMFAEMARDRGVP